MWQRTVQGSSTLSGSFDAATYGVATPAAGVPRTGSASYAIDLLGAIAFLDLPVSLRGSGSMNVRFGLNNFDFSGTYDQVRVTDGQPAGSGMFSGTGTIAGAANDLGGSIELFPFPGTLNGRFYGPGAEEVGAAWSFASVQGVSGSGTLTGRRPASTGGTFLDSPATYTGLEHKSLAYQVNSAGHLMSSIGDNGQQFVQTFEVAPSGLAFRLTGDSGAGRTASFAASSRVAAASNGVFTTYRTTTAAEENTFRVFNTGNANSEIQLTYAGFGQWLTELNPSAATSDVFDRYFTYGQRTAAGLIPTTGSASYSGKVYGSGYGTGGATRNLYDMTGNFALTFLFGGGQFNGHIDATLKDRGDNGTFALDRVTISGNFPSLQWVGQASGGGLLGGVAGGFYGPNIDEVAATYQFGGGTSIDDNSFLYVMGVMAGKRE